MSTQIRAPEDGDMSWGYRMVSFVEYIGDPANAKLYRIEGVKLAEVVFHYRSGQWVPDGGYRFVDEVVGDNACGLIDEMARMMQATQHPVIPEEVLSDYNKRQLWRMYSPESAAVYADFVTKSNKPDGE